MWSRGTVIFGLLFEIHNIFTYGKLDWSVIFQVFRFNLKGEIMSFKFCFYHLTNTMIKFIYVFTYLITYVYIFML